MLIICDAITEIAFWRPGDDINWKRIKSPFGPIRSFLKRQILGVSSIFFLYPGPNPTMKLVELKVPIGFGTKYLVDFMGELLLFKRDKKRIGERHYVT